MRGQHESSARSIKKAKRQAIKESFDMLAYEEEVHTSVLEKSEKDLKILCADDKKL